MPLTVHGIYRGFCPVSGALGAGVTILSAVLNLYVQSKTDYDNDGDDWINIVEASKPDTATTALVVGDFDLCVILLTQLKYPHEKT